MFKNILRYCSHCNKATLQTKESSGPIGLRIFIGILSLGASETAIQHWYKCIECGKNN